MPGRVCSKIVTIVKPRVRWCCRALVPIVASLLPSIGQAQSYLDAIELEVRKLDGDAAEESATRTPKTGEGQAREDFERELEARYRGSYLFYKKLPSKSQEEVYQEYVAGASIDAVRKTIMNRFLHSR